MKKIMLDAGHYGNYNRSPVVPEYWESRRMWLLCEYLAEELKKYGFIVLKTRDNIEKNVEVYARGKMAKGCDLFISLHSNAASSETVDRVDVYAAYDNLNNSHVLGAKFAKGIADLMGVSQGKVKTRKGSDGNEYYGVLRGARRVKCPLFYIIEHSFHTNIKATRWLLKDKNLLELAKLEAEIIASYYGVKMPINQENTATNKTEPPKVETPKVETPKVETPKVETPKVETPKVETPKVEPPKVEPPKVEPPKVEPPKVEPPKVEPPKVEPPKVEPPKVEPPKVEPPKDETSKVESPKVESPKVEIPNSQPSNAEKPKLEMGDVDGDGDMDIDDAELIKNAYFKRVKLDQNQTERADFNKNGKIDMGDYMLTKRMSFRK